MKKVLIPNGNLSEWALVNAAHKLGLYVITSGLNENAPANAFADEYVKADYSDKEAMVSLAKKLKIDYMVSNAHDFGFLSTSYVCEKLGLPGHDSYNTTYILHHKDTLKPLAKKLGLHMPISESFDNKEDAIAFLKKSSTRMILKPSDNVSSRGVSSPKNQEEFQKAVDYAFENSNSHKIMIEPYIEGFYCTADAMIVNQKVRAFVADSNLIYSEGTVQTKEFPMYGRSNGVVRPAPYINEFAPIVIDDFNKLARELKLVDGPIHCELLVDKDHQPHIFDMHRRMSGMPEPWVNWNATVDVDWVKYLVKAECGMPINDFPEGLIQKRYLHARNIYAPKDGIIKKIEFDEYLTSRIYPKYDGKHYAIYDRYVVDHARNPIINSMPPNVNGRLYFRFDTAEEANYVGSTEEDHFYSHITFEYED